MDYSYNKFYNPGLILTIRPLAFTQDALTLGLLMLETV